MGMALTNRQVALAVHPTAPPAAWVLNKGSRGRLNKQGRLMVWQWCHGQPRHAAGGTTWLWHAADGRTESGTHFRNACRYAGTDTYICLPKGSPP